MASRWRQLMAALVAASVAGMLAGSVRAAAPSPAAVSLKFVTVDLRGAAGTTVSGINNAGDLTGDYETPSGVYHGFLQAEGRVVRFDPPGSIGTFPSGINDTGTVAGSYLDAAGVAHGFIRSAAGVFTVINDPGAAASEPGTEVETLNDYGTIVGEYFDAHGNFHGFVDRGEASPPSTFPMRWTPRSSGSTTTACSSACTPTAAG